MAKLDEFGQLCRVTHNFAIAKFGFIVLEGGRCVNAKFFGKKIKLARVELDMTQTDLAKKIGANQKSVSRYENGLSVPALETMEKIARVLKKPVDHFLR